MEGTLLFPVVIVCLITLLLFAGFTYQRTALHHAADRTAERTAFVWDNPHKDPVTGAFPLGKYDGLYWRLFRDGGFHPLALFAGHPDAQIDLPADRYRKAATGPAGKLQKGTQFLPLQSEGKLVYHNGWLERTVRAELLQSAVSPNVPLPVRFNGHAVSAAARVAEPVELLRLVDWTKHYADRIRRSMSPERLVRVLEETAGGAPVEAMPPIRSHAEALAYVKTLIAGKSVEFPTETAGKRRIVDILDADGVAHEVKYTVNQTDALEQIKKDAELLRKGLVKGVVWHFFKHAVTGKTGLTEKLRRELVRHGIIIVVHE